MTISIGLLEGTYIRVEIYMRGERVKESNRTQEKEKGLQKERSDGLGALGGEGGCLL